MTDLTLSPSVKNDLWILDYRQYREGEVNNEDLPESPTEKTAYEDPAEVGQLPSSYSTWQLGLNPEESSFNTEMISAYGEPLSKSQTENDWKTRVESSKTHYAGSSYLVELLYRDVNEDSLISASDAKKIVAEIGKLFSLETIIKSKSEIVKLAYEHLFHVGKLSRSDPTPPKGRGPVISKSRKHDNLPNNEVDANLVKSLTVEAELGKLFSLAAWEDFEDGVETEFSRQIEDFVRKHQDTGIQAIWSAIVDERYFEQDIAEALLWIGLMRDSTAIGSRRGLLVFALQSESVFIRDSAVSALSYLADTSVIEVLTRQLDVETSEGVKSNIRSVLRYLRRLK